jgi:hypothetical protein
MTPELQLRELQGSPELVRVVHYGCESWYNVKDRPVTVPATPRVSHLSAKLSHRLTRAWR